jgi:KilA-N domain
MKLYELFTSTFEHDIVVREEDGYVNVGNLCRANGKLFTGWLRNRESQLILEQLSTIFDYPLIETSKSKNRHGTFVHPVVAILVAQWVSPKFNVVVAKWAFELLFTGSVEQSGFQSMTELDRIYKEKFDLEQKYNKLALNHEKIKTKKTEHKFREGNCFYLVRNITESDEKYKFGITNNITTRMRTYRTISPLIYIHRVVYLEEHAKLEQYVKIAFNVQDGIMNNHEFIVDVPIETINKKLDTMLQLFDSVDEIPQDVLKQINAKILNGMHDFEIGQERYKTSDKVKDLEQEQDKTSKKVEELEQEKNNTSKKVNELERQMENIVRSLAQGVPQFNSQSSPTLLGASTVEKLEQSSGGIEQTTVIKTEDCIQVEATVSTCSNIKLPEFTSDTPVEHRFRRNDFKIMVQYIVDNRLNLHAHQQFMTRFIMYMGYYTGICAHDLLTMTEQDMVDYIDGKQIKIGKYEIFTNEYIASQFNVFKDLKHLIKPGGMVNVRGERITPRRFHKWMAPIFDKLEFVNFGQNYNPGKYTFQDFRGTFINNLFHSSIQKYEIHRYLSHVVVANWEKELKKITA